MVQTMWDLLLTNATLATMRDNSPYGLISDGAIGIHSGRIAWIGALADLPIAEGSSAREIHDLKGSLVTPGLIDCHTHLVYGGDRAREFEARLLGKSYEEIARAGGGILSTVNATRAASEDELVKAALPRLDALIAEGVTTVEIKSGYGLDTENELKMLRAARRLEHERAVRIKTTLLAAHALPPEFKDKPDDYITLVCEEILPAASAEGLADAVDGFCEGIGFSCDQMRRVFDKATSLGLSVKLHAEQLSDLGGAKMAAGYGALSADHLEYLKPEDAGVLADAGTVAVLLPGAFYYLRETKLPPIDALRAAKAPMALATDCNPGTSPLTSLLLTMNMGCTLFRMTPEEALAGVTRNAVKALGLDGDAGTIEIGKRADLCVWRAGHPSELSYMIGHNPLKMRIFGGKR
ncbi:imidazolonepropionase [Hyphococcus flavus]|uniref:Imidazolonepropionase n=1 Tax=Hyphococcus flavus TaxID=1866326 RepID=A0AAE9ZDB1_9PROT|nr:imidazolonepropionase [Hyphococcus flavus]WDI31475.1 imidazolonepropionase [Hyphococcus flavus]